MLWTMIAPLAAAVLGGFVGAWANSWYRDRESKRAQDEERKGLLILLSAELKDNLRLLDLIWVGPLSVPIAQLRTEVWGDIQLRFAQLFPSDYVEEVAQLYSVVAIQAISPIARKRSHEEMTETERRAVAMIMDNSVSIMRRAETYVNDQHFTNSVDIFDEQAHRPS